jgi:hypothetical protein
MRYAMMVGVLALCSGCAIQTGPDQRALSDAVVRAVCSYKIGVTTETQFCGNWDYPPPEPIMWAIVEGRRPGVLDTQRSTSAGCAIHVYWVGYRRYLPYDTHITDRRMYALTFTNGVLSNIYEP